jgi:hypothetical protein
MDGQLSFDQWRSVGEIESEKLSYMNRTSIIVLLFAAAGILTLSPLASAQSCALCYTQAASSGARMIHALRSGILILVAPPTLMTIGAIVVCYRKRNQTREAHLHDSERGW